MQKVQVFDPALCCSSGVCGTDVDQALVNFSADVDWARHNGVPIERFNLAQQPMAFAEHEAVKDMLQRVGEAALPITLIDGQVVLSGSYPQRETLAGWLNIPLTSTVSTPQPIASHAGDIGQKTTAGCCCHDNNAETAKPAGSCCCGNAT